MSDIAKIAGVGPSAVSNWKKRQPDFPGEVEEGLYDRGEVVAWLQKEGKTVQLSDREPTADALWRWASGLRGHLRVDEMPELLLQLITLRAASSRRYERLNRLASAWERLTSDPAQLGVTLAETPAQVSDSDPDLARALRPSHLVARVGDAPLGHLIRLVDQLDPVERDWGRLATTVLERFLHTYAAKGGEYSTAAGLADIIAGLLEPIEGTVYDPACGAAMFLASAWRRNESRIKHLFGQEIREQSWRLGFLHLLLNQAPFEVVTGDTLVDDRFRSLRADRIALDPPLGLTLGSRDGVDFDERWAFGVPPPSSGDLTWAQHVIYHLAEGGIGAVAVTSATLSRAGREAEIRQGIVRSDMLDAVIQLPPGLVATTQLPVALLLFQRGRPNRTKHLLFIDARQLGKPQRGGLRVLEEEEIQRIVATVRSWRLGNFEEEAQFSGAATADEIGASKVNLSPNRYVAYARVPTDIEGEPIPDRLQRLGDGLQGRVSKLPQLLEDLERQLGRIEVSTDAE